MEEKRKYTMWMNDGGEIRGERGGGKAYRRRGNEKRGKKTRGKKEKCT